MERLRRFEIAKGWENKGINMHIRKTAKSAAYDLEAAEDTVIPSFKLGQKPTLIPTGLKAFMQSNEVLMLFPRSSSPKKQGIIFPHSAGIIDADYYGNVDNDGHIMIQCFNIKEEDIIIKKGEAIAQAMFQNFLVTDDDCAEGERVGGFGSTSAN